MKTKYKSKKQWQLLELRRLLKLNLSKTKIAKKLGCSRDTIYELIKRIHDESFTEHKLSKNEPTNKVNIKIKTAIVNEYLSRTKEINKFRGNESFLMTHSLFYDEFIKDKFQVSLRMTSKILTDSLIASPAAYKSTKRKVRKKIKAKKRGSIQKEIIAISKHENFKDFKPHRGKDGIAGDIAEIDASQELWFNSEKCHCYNAIDAQTSVMLSCHFELQETTLGYYNLLHKLFSNSGSPRVIKTDKRRSFWASESTQTLLATSLANLDIDLQSCSDATFKANVERSFKNCQQFFPLLFAKHGINTLEKLQAFEDKIPALYNAKYGYEMPKENNFITLEQNLIDEEMTLKAKVKVTNGNVFSLNGSLMCAYTQDNKRVVLQPQSKLVVRTDIFSGSHFLIHKNKKYLARETSPDDIFEDLYNEAIQKKYNHERQMEKEKAINRLVSINLEKRQIILNETIAKYEKMLSEIKKQSILNG